MDGFGQKQQNRQREAPRPARQSSAVTAYQNEFRSMASPQTGTDDRAGNSEPIQLSISDIANSRFYGASAHRKAQMVSLSQDVESKNGNVDVMNQTVDKLNAGVGITSAPFQSPNLTFIRDMVMDAVTEKGPKSPNPEVQAWGAWLLEGSRLFALLMPELNSEICRREMHLDEDAKESASDAEQVETTEAEENVERIDPENKRIFIGDKKRMDNLSNWINSGQTREIDGQQYQIYWTQESYGVDSMRQVDDNYHSWTPEMKQIHEKSMQGKGDALTILQQYGYLEEAAKKQYISSGLRKAAQKAQEFKGMVYNKTTDWVNTTVKNRFFRLTSLMGLDFFKSRGNTIQFARDIGQENYAEDRVNRVNRVITDSEWAHAQRMGYAGAGGNVHRVNATDRFQLQQ